MIAMETTFVVVKYIRALELELKLELERFPIHRFPLFPYCYNFMVHLFPCFMIWNELYTLLALQFERVQEYTYIGYKSLKYFSSNEKKNNFKIQFSRVEEKSWNFGFWDSWKMWYSSSFKSIRYIEDKLQNWYQYSMKSPFGTKKKWKKKTRTSSSTFKLKQIQSISGAQLISGLDKIEKKITRKCDELDEHLINKQSDWITNWWNKSISSTKSLDSPPQQSFIYLHRQSKSIIIIIQAKNLLQFLLHFSRINLCKEEKELSYSFYYFFFFSLKSNIISISSR